MKIALAVIRLREPITCDGLRIKQFVLREPCLRDVVRLFQAARQPDATGFKVMLALISILCDLPIHVVEELDLDDHAVILETLARVFASVPMAHDDLWEPTIAACDATGLTLYDLMDWPLAEIMSFADTSSVEVCP